MTTPTNSTVAALLFLLVIPVTLPAQSTEHHRLLPGDGAPSDSFGASIATDGALVAVGAPAANQSGAASGTAYLFAVADGSERLELVPGDGAAGDHLGAAIAIDQGLVLVGAPLADGVGQDSGAVYVFDANSGNELFKLEATDAAAGDQFGHAVAMHGMRAVIGTLGAAYLFDVASGQQLHKLMPIGGTTTLGLSAFGEAVAIDADRVVVGARLENGVSGLAGAVYVYDAATGAQLHRLVAQDGAAWDNFGASVGIDGDLIAIGSPEASPIIWHSGAAYLFDAATGQQTLKVLPNDGHLQAKFGSSIGVDGPHVVIGARQNNNNGVFTSGAVYVFEAPGGAFVDKLSASDAGTGDELGTAVAVARGVLVAGAAHDDDNGNDSGSAYVFDGTGTVTTMSGCFGNAGALGHVDGLPIAGQTLIFRIDSAQAGATFALLGLAANPVAGWPSCGVHLGVAGELMVDAPVTVIAAPWTGAATDFTVTLPAVGGLVGFPFYLQGAFVAVAPSLEPLRLTGGLEVVLGGYL